MSNDHAKDRYDPPGIGTDWEENNYGDMYFQDTLIDWSGFNINNRTKYDATISSGLAIMACNKNRYRPIPQRSMKKINLGIKRYDNKGIISKLI